jgi:hypothetical protein
VLVFLVELEFPCVGVVVFHQQETRAPGPAKTTEENDKGALLFAVSIWPVCMANILKPSMKSHPNAPAKWK